MMSRVSECVSWFSFYVRRAIVCYNSIGFQKLTLSSVTASLSHCLRMSCDRMPLIEKTTECCVLADLQSDVTSARSLFNCHPDCSSSCGSLDRLCITVSRSDSNLERTGSVSLDLPVWRRRQWILSYSSLQMGKLNVDIPIVVEKWESPASSSFIACRFSFLIRLLQTVVSVLLCWMLVRRYGEDFGLIACYLILRLLARHWFRLWRCLCWVSIYVALVCRFFGRCFWGRGWTFWGTFLPLLLSASQHSPNCGFSAGLLALLWLCFLEHIEFLGLKGEIFFWAWRRFCCGFKFAC